MAMKAIRMRVRDGHLEPLEALQLAEGTEITAMVPVPERPEDAAKPRISFPKWDLGVKEPLTRRAIYEDVG
jgi:hypothetical protein